MEIHTGFLRLGIVVTAAVLLSAGAAGVVQAQIGQYGGQSGPALQLQNAPPVPGAPSIDTARSLDLRQAAEHALILGDWLVTPSAFIGGIYDTNPGQEAKGFRSSEGLRLDMSGLAERNTGISKTDIYGMADGRIYTGNNNNGSNLNTLTAQLGVLEAYQPLPDWSFSGQGDFTRQKDLFDTFGLNHSVTSLNTTANGLAPTNAPVAYNQFSGAASAGKSFNTFFVNIGGGVVSQIYDQTSVGNDPNNTVYSVNGRGGIWLTPDINGFVQATGDSRNYDSGLLNSTGYQTSVGLATGRIGLMQGEVHVGYQEEDYQSRTIAQNSGLAFGGQLNYAPLKQLNFNLGFDRTIGSTQTSATTGTSTTATDVIAAASYKIAPEWSLTGRAGYIHTDYATGNQSNDSWTFGPTLTYSIWQNFGLTLDYQHIEMTSNVALTGFTRDVVTAGVSYHY